MGLSFCGHNATKKVLAKTRPSGTLSLGSDAGPVGTVSVVVARLEWTAGSEVMGKRADGNGHSKFNIVTHERGTDCVIFAPETIIDLPKQVAIYLCRTVDTWVQDHPYFRVRCVLPIVDDGKTITIMLWYDR